MDSQIETKKENAAIEKKEINSAKNRRQTMESKSVKDTENSILENDTDSKFTSSKPIKKAITPVTSNTGLKFRVQFMTSDKEVPLDGQEFKNIPNLKKYVQGQIFKYTAGDESTPKDAERIRQLVAGKGYRDAFVLPFFNENRITMKEALDMIKNKQ